jgi:glucokinase
MQASIEYNILLKEVFMSIQLAGDVGGTKTALVIIDSELGPRNFLEKATYASADYPSLDALVQEFLKGKKWQLARASIDVAGPVVNGRCQATNLPWMIDEISLSKDLGVPVRLVNDLDAISNAVPVLETSDLETLNPGVPVKHGALAVIAPGTGLGEGFLEWNGGCYQPHPSEGGHTDFAPSGPLQLKLLNYLMDRFGHVSYERVCSGIGFPNLYAFFKDSGIFNEPAWLQEQIAAAQDPVPVICRAALEDKAEIAVATLDLFVSILGSEAGNLALKVLATGGVYLGGGIPPRIIPFLKKAGFSHSFQNKGRFSGLLANVPIHIILNHEAALIGAARYGLELGR